MKPSTARTITLLVEGDCCAPERYCWPVKEPESALDYSADATIPMEDIEETIIIASLAIRPSGAGEMQAISLSIDDLVITARLAGGVAGRDYILKLLIVAPNELVLEYLISLKIDPLLATKPIHPPPNPGFGPAIVATVPGYVPSLNFSMSLNSGYASLISGV
ncbi:MAG: hypothetical protein WDN25_13480 [Acetobacteraceae bacterium]